MSFCPVQRFVVVCQKANGSVKEFAILEKISTDRQARQAHGRDIPGGNVMFMLFSTIIFNGQ